MNVAELNGLLASPEATWIDWKRDIPAGLVAGKSNPDWDKARAELLKDLVAIANGNDGRSSGCLVYGVRDDGSNRTIVGISKSGWDDAMFQVWAEKTFEPPPKFSYSEIEPVAGRIVGIFVIHRVANYPHVVVANLGDILHDGQLWFRRGTKNTIAHAEDLRSMFRGDEPFRFSTTHDQTVKKIIDETATSDWEPVLPLAIDKEARIAAGYEVVYYPGTRREIWIGGKGQEVILMRRKRP